MGEVKEFKKVTADKNDDDAYCEALYREYLCALEEDKEVVSMEDAVKMLESRELDVPDSISSKTLKDMDKAISNLEKSSVSPAIDLSDF